MEPICTTESSHFLRFIGTAQVPGRLVDVGRYPGLLLGEGQVTSEVYEVDDALLARLGHPRSRARILKTQRVSP